MTRVFGLVMLLAAPGGAAVSVTSLTSGNTATCNPSCSTASITPPANKVVLVTVFGGQAMDNITGPTSVSGNGLTWTQVQTLGFNSGGGTNRRNLTMYRGIAASPSTGTITFTFPETRTQVLWDVVYLDGVDTGGTNGANAIVQSPTASNASQATITIIFATFGSTGNGAYAFFGNGLAGTTGTPRTNWTELSDQTLSTATTESQWISSSDTAASVTWANNGTAGAIGVELKQAAALQVSHHVTGN